MGKRKGKPFGGLIGGAAKAAAKGAAQQGKRMAGMFGPMGVLTGGILGGMYGKGRSRRKPDMEGGRLRGPWGGGRSSEPYPRGPRGGGGGQRGQWVNKETGDAWLSKGRGDYAPGRRARQGDKPEDWAEDPRLDKYTFKPTYRN